MSIQSRAADQIFQPIICFDQKKFWLGNSDIVLWATQQAKM
jgi:hypothetical protein